VGGRFGVAAGHIVLLPTFRELNEEVFFESCLEYRFEREGTTQPDWGTGIHFPGEDSSQENISGIKKQLDYLHESLNVALKNHDELVSMKRLLYEKGDSDSNQ